MDNLEFCGYGFLICRKQDAQAICQGKQRWVFCKRSRAMSDLPKSRSAGIIYGIDFWLSADICEKTGYTKRSNRVYRTGGIELTGKYYDQIVEYILANQEKFYRLAYSYIKNPDGAMDVVQNAICRALDKSRTLRDIKAVNTWFYRILVNECLMYIRKHDKEVPVDAESWEGWKAGIYIESAFEPEEDISDKLDRLKPEVKTVILLYYFEDLTLKEIAEVTDTNLNTVKSRMYSGLRKLKGFIKEDSD